jgi:release factor glutamine methyltransferase
MAEEPRVAQALRDAAGVLATTSDTARLDAEVLMAEALGVTRSDLLLRHMDGPMPEAFAAMVERRMRHEPVAYIVGHQEFYGLDLAVTPAVLIPRADSETLIEAAREALGDRAPARILDLGTGSGALLLAAMSVWPKARGLGIDRSAEALEVASANARRLELENSCELVRLDWKRSDWSAKQGQFDLILANPPYVEDGADLSPSVRDFEPAPALFSGPDGLDDHRLLIPQLPRLLNQKNGVAVLEIGPAQAHLAIEIAERAGFSAVLREDLAGRPRALVLRIGLGKAALPG